MTLALFTGFSVSVSAEGTNCTGNHTDWTEISDASGFNNITSGNYVLTDNVTLNNQVYINSGVDVTLCLNGKTITAESNTFIFSVSGSLTLCDCSSGGNGTLTGGNNINGVGTVYVYTNAKFIMNGGTISNNTAGNGGGVYVYSNGTFIMNGGTISNNTASLNGGGVYVGNSGTFIMNGGTIGGTSDTDKNTASNSGGGVYVVGTFTMSGGTISNNTASASGGVNVASGTFTMNGGTISNNKAGSNGGGVFVSSGEFTMNGGTISNNEASNGGGVFATGGEFKMSGSGTISNNKAGSNGGGVYTQGGTFTINGKVDISGNTKTDNSANNVALNTDRTITIGSGFDTASKIGVYTTATPTCTSFVDVTGETSDVSGSFTADIDGQSIVYEDGKVQLKGAHTYVNGVCTVCGDTENPNTGDDDNNNDSIDLKTDGSTLTISGTGAVNSEDLSEVADKDSITDVVIEDGVTSIGDGAFSGFTGLETVTVPDSVQSIGENAFDGTKLETVFYERGTTAAEDLPANVTKVEYSVSEGGIVIENIILGSGAAEGDKVVIPDKIGGVSVVAVDEGVRDMVSPDEGHEHNYANGSCTICGSPDPAAGSGEPIVSEPTGSEPTVSEPTGSSPIGTSPTAPSNPPAPSRPSAPSNPSNPSSPAVTAASAETTVTAATAEEIIADDTYTGEDVSAGAGDASDDGGITDMSMFVILLAIAAAISAAVLVKKIVF